MSTLPSQTQMMLPLLETLRDAGGSARPSQVYDEVATRLAVSNRVRNRTVTLADGRVINEFERRVRWTRQTAVFKGLIAKPERATWLLTDKANSKLANIVRGAVLTVFETERGFFLWANAEDAIAVIEEGSVDLLMTSPPYPLLRKKAYGNPSQARWVDWMLGLCEGWCRLLTPTGSMMLNLGPCWEEGVPTQSIYIERLLVRLEDALGIHLLQRLDWHSPTKLPTPLRWVGIDRCRLKASIEPILWISPNPHAKGNNRNVLVPYSKGGLRSIRDAKDHARRPSGLKFGITSWVDCGGAIPPSLITVAADSAEERRYRKAERAMGREPHPALLPAKVAQFGILLATDEQDTVYDPMAGSGTVPVEAMKLKRYGIGSERSLQYVESAIVRAAAEGISGERLIA